VAYRLNDRLIAWLLVILVTLVAGLREGLHALPGMGHAVRVGEQVIVLGDTGGGSPGTPVFAAGGTTVSGSDPLRILNPSDCPLCRLLALTFVAGPAGTTVLAEIEVRQSASAPVAHGALMLGVYQARAPPQA